MGWTQVSRTIRRTLYPLDQYFSSSTVTFVWSKNTIRESSHIYFFGSGDPFCKVVWRPENTHGGADRFAWVASGYPPSLKSQADPRPFAWTTSSSHPFAWATSRCPTYFLFMAGYRNLYTSVFIFPVICWSYLQTEISDILSTGNKLHSRHHTLFFSFLWNHFVDVILRPHWIC